MRVPLWVAVVMSSDRCRREYMDLVKISND